MDELNITNTRQKLIDERIAVCHNISSVLFSIFFAILAMSCTDGISNSHRILLSR